MRNRIVQLLCALRLLLRRRQLTGGRHGARRDSGSPVPATSPAPRLFAPVSGPWVVDVERGRFRRWARAGQVPDCEVWPPVPVPRGAYYVPPQPWEKTGTVNSPRVGSGAPWEATR